MRLEITDELVDALVDPHDDTLIALRAALLRDLARPVEGSTVTTMVTTLPRDLGEALDEVDSEYFVGEIDREEWADRRDSLIAWFAERGIRHEPDDEPDDAGD